MSSGMNPVYSLLSSISNIIGKVYLTVDFHLFVPYHHFNVPYSSSIIPCTCLQFNYCLFLMPAFFDGCGYVFSLCHALYYCRGGLVTQYHNVASDALADLDSVGHIWETVPFAVSVNGALGHEPLMFLHCLAEKLSVGCRGEKLTAHAIVTNSDYFV